VIPTDWLAVIFNPSFPTAWHMATAAFVATAFFVGSSAAWHLLRGKDNPAIRKMLSMAMWMALIVAPIQAVIGDFHGLNTLEHQPAKIAAIEGHWENKGNEPTPLILFGWPDMKAEKTKYAVEIPYLGSLILTHSLDKQVPALKEFPPEDRPNSTIVFWSFRVMVGLGLLMIFTGLWSLWLRRGDTLYSCSCTGVVDGPVRPDRDPRRLVHHRNRRQPWVVYGLMRTADASSNTASCR
jgi:cytochrome d ubiquinol oxidase subunit I